MKSKPFIALLTVMMLFSCPLISKAQDDPGTDPDVSVPIDGGLSLLLAAGVSYGVKKAHDKRKKAEKDVMDK